MSLFLSPFVRQRQHFPGIDPQGPIIACSYAAPCLFDLSNDPFEHDDIAAANPVIVSQLLALFATYTAQWHVPNSVPSNIAALNEKLASNTLHFGKAYLSPWAYLSTLPNVTYLQRQAALSAPAPAPVPAPVLAPVAAPITPTSQPSEQCSSSSYNRGLAVGLGVGLGLGLPLLIIIAVAYIKFTSASSVSSMCWGGGGGGGGDKIMRNHLCICFDPHDRATRRPQGLKSVPILCDACGGHRQPSLIHIQLRIALSLPPQPNTTMF